MHVGASVSMRSGLGTCFSCSKLVMVCWSSLCSDTALSLSLLTTCSSSKRVWRKEEEERGNRGRGDQTRDGGGRGEERKGGGRRGKRGREEGRGEEGEEGKRGREGEEGEEGKRGREGGGGE